MGRGWRAFSYIMGANFQALFLIFAASNLEKSCRLDSAWICGFKPFFFPCALLVSAYVYYQVVRALIRMDKDKKV